MAKKVFFIVFFIISSYVSARQQSVVFGIGRYYEKGIEQGTTPIYGLATFSGKKQSGLIGVQVTDQVFDLTCAAAWWPFSIHTLNRNLETGCSLLYHFQHYTEISNEHDLIGGLTFRYTSAYHFYSLLSIGYMEKVTTVFAVKKYVPYLFDKSLAFNLLVDKKWRNGVELFGGFGSHDLFRYLLFLSPSVTFGIAANTNKSLRFSSAVEVRFSDMFVAAVNIDSLLFRCSLGYLF